jgi:hypothetical protein
MQTSSGNMQARALLGKSSDNEERKHGDSSSESDDEHAFFHRKNQESSEEEEEPVSNVYKLTGQRGALSNLSEYILPDETLKDKTNKWRQISNKRYSQRRKHGYQET